MLSNVAVQGLILRGSVAHGDQRFEIPILLTKDPDIRTVLLAYLAPPLLCYSLNRFAVRPLWRRHRLAKVCMPCQALPLSCMILWLSALQFHCLSS